jgi:hypothetical protein
VAERPAALPAYNMQLILARITYRVFPNGTAGGWYWEVTSDRQIIARGLASSHVRAAASFIENSAEELSPGA